MKKLLSIILCAVMLCSVAVFSTSAEDEMTIEELDKSYFGNYYIDDYTAAKFALNGYPGVDYSMFDYVLNKWVNLGEVYFAIDGLTEESMSLVESRLEENFPENSFDASVEFSFTEVEVPTQGSIGNMYVRLYGYVQYFSSVDLAMFNIKCAYALTQIAKECGVEGVRIVIDAVPGNTYPISWTADVNGDGKINARDILAIKRYMVGIDYRIAVYNDPNRDNAINAKDILTIKRYIVGVEEYTYSIWIPDPDSGNYRQYNPLKGFFG